jgi:hypothetical protein
MPASKILDLSPNRILQVETMERTTSSNRNSFYAKKGGRYLALSQEQHVKIHHILYNLWHHGSGWQKSWYFTCKTNRYICV